MKFVFLGPPGAGKGTLAAKVAKQYHILHISTGNMFREEMHAGTALGEKIQLIINAGKLVDDETTIALVKKRLAQPDTAHGFILDGFPRTIFQAEQLATFCTLDAVIDFKLSDDVILERLSGRRVCKVCGHNFHVKFLKPETDGVCDYCKGPLITRQDDKKESIIKRLELYKAQTMPLIDFYRAKHTLTPLDASLPIPEVLALFMKTLPIEV